MNKQRRNFISCKSCSRRAPIHYPVKSSVSLNCANNINSQLMFAFTGRNRKVYFNRKRLEHLQKFKNHPRRWFRPKFWKFETNKPRRGTAQSQFQFPHSCFCEQFTYMYIPTIGLPILLQENMWTDPGAHIHECGNWDWCHAIHFLGINKWDFFGAV